ncbi:hypothetical protein C2U68_09660 [Methylomonas koyamae]|nr:hypothetical protein C2U68_09660 [Methylomonas koyamae]
MVAEHGGTGNGRRKVCRRPLAAAFQAEPAKESRFIFRKTRSGHAGIVLSHFLQESWVLSTVKAGWAGPAV